MRVSITFPPDEAALIYELARLEYRTVSNWVRHHACSAAEAMVTPAEGKVVPLHTGLMTPLEGDADQHPMPSDG